MDDATAEAGLSGPVVIKNLLAAAYDKARWEPFRAGIEVSWLYRTPAGARAAFLRYVPGATLARHDHRGYEHVFVIAGSQTDDNGEHRAGSLLVHPPGTNHAVRSDGGCVAFVIWERPVSFHPDPAPPAR